MTVIAPCDSIEAEKATLILAGYKKPAYLRLAREPLPIITTKDTPFEIGKAYVFEQGSDVTIITTGSMTHNALIASEMLYKEGIEAEVIHCPTIKPLDAATILKSVKKTKRVVTAEEHQIAGGLGGVVAEFLAEHCPVPMYRVGVRDQFGQSGTPAELFEHYGLTAKDIALAVHKVVGFK